MFYSLQRALLPGLRAIANTSSLWKDIPKCLGTIDLQKLMKKVHITPFVCHPRVKHSRGIGGHKLEWCSAHAVGRPVHFLRLLERSVACLRSICNRIIRCRRREPCGNRSQCIVREQLKLCIELREEIVTPSLAQNGEANRALACPSRKLNQKKRESCGRGQFGVACSGSDYHGQTGEKYALHQHPRKGCIAGSQNVVDTVNICADRADTLFERVRGGTRV